MTGEIKAITIITLITVAIIIGGISLSGTNTNKPEIKIDQSILFSSSTPIQYSETAKISIIGFEDFSCPACAMLHPNLKLALANYGEQVSFGLRIIPIHGSESIRSAVAAFAAGEQGKFFEMADQLFLNQTKWSKKSDTESKVLFTEYATTIGLDIPSFTTLINSPDFIDRVESIVAKDRLDAQKMKITSTPTLVINGKTVIVGVKTPNELRKLIDIEIASNNMTQPLTSTSTKI